MDLLEHYQEYFYVTKADTPELLKEAFRLRYEIFVKDCGYKLGSYDDINKIEKDVYDDAAKHCLLIHKPTNKPIGYVRLILYSEIAGQSLPIESYSNDFIDFTVISVEELRSNKTGELSRLSIHPSFRRRISDHFYQLNNNGMTKPNRFSINYLPMCLFLTCAALMFDNKIEYSFALMDKRLAAILKKMGFRLKLIGKSIEYHGIRSPYMIYGEKTYENVSDDFQSLYKIIHSELNLIKTPVFYAEN